MSTTTHTMTGRPNRLVALAIASLLLGACATAPVKPNGADAVRAKLTRLESNPELATRAPEALKEAEAAVVIAEMPQSNPEIADSNVYLADRKVDIAVSRAQTKLLEDQRTTLERQRDKARLDARTHEADVSDRKLAVAHDQLADKELQVQVAHAEAGAATLAAANSQAAADDLQQQLNDLHGRPTDHGMVITLGDVIFGSSKAQLSSAVVPNLDRLVVFLNHYPNRSIAIAGYTDNRGSNDYNLGLSERRANTVKLYLVQGGIDTRRISSSGMGSADPVAGNDTPEGRQQNRRVEVTISQPPAASR